MYLNLDSSIEKSIHINTSSCDIYLVLEKIIGAKSKIKILRRLAEAQEREYCLEDIVKITKQSFGTVYPALKDLVDSRIVLVKKIGKSKLYKINTRHVLFDKIRELLMEERGSFANIAKEFSDSLKKSGIRNIVLFGSAARGDFGEKSDIDVLVIYTNKKPEKNVAQVRESLLGKYDVDIVPIYLSTKEVKQRLKKIDKFMLNALEEGKILYGDARWLGK